MTGRNFDKAIGALTPEQIALMIPIHESAWTEKKLRTVLEVLTPTQTLLLSPILGFNPFSEDDLLQEVGLSSSRELDEVIHNLQKALAKCGIRIQELFWIGLNLGTREAEAEVFGQFRLPNHLSARRSSWPTTSQCPLALTCGLTINQPN